MREKIFIYSEVNYVIHSEIVLLIRVSLSEDFFFCHDRSASGDESLDEHSVPEYLNV